MQTSDFQDGGTRVCCSFDGIVTEKLKLFKGGNLNLPSQSAYSGKIPIKKKNDVAKVMHYIPDQHKLFYENILNWPTSVPGDDDSQ